MKTIYCPHCAHAMADDGSLAGQDVSCQRCNQRFTMPGELPQVIMAPRPSSVAPRRSPPPPRGNDFSTWIVPGGIVLGGVAVLGLVVGTTAPDAAKFGLPIAVLLALWLVGLVVYFIPTAIAIARGHRNAAAIIVLNIFLGWSFIGWVVALVWSFTSD